MKYKICFFLLVIFGIIMTSSISYAAARGRSGGKSYTGISVTTATESATLETAELTTEAPTETTTAFIETTTEATTEIPRDAFGNPLRGDALEIYNVSSAMPANTAEKFTMDRNENTIENDLAVIKQTDIKLSNNDYYWIRRYEFKQTNKQDYYSSILIPGNKIEVRYVDTDKNEWVNTSNFNNLKPATYFIDTDIYSMVLSIPAVYDKDMTSNTLTLHKEYEKAAVIEKVDDGYKISFRFPQNENMIGEIWALQSGERLVDWNKASNFNELKTHDLCNERRWSWDGYYFKIPYNYIPYGDNVLYRHPANYTGSSWAKYNDYRLAKDLGYIMTRICAENQNTEGYWATGPRSLWLEKDFDIKENFYDTRFNTDFATCLIFAYKNYNDKLFLNSVLKYGEFFIRHANSHHYTTDNDGWLVEDYAGGDDALRTHTSLNHQLAEINFLYEMHNMTGAQKYKDLADKMLKGIEDTKPEWIKEDKNLNYAVMYNGTANTMVDYPYLTYNDLYMTKEILYKYYNTSSEAVEELMKNKKEWMDAHNITEYKK